MVPKLCYRAEIVPRVPMWAFRCNGYGADISIYPSSAKNYSRTERSNGCTLTLIFLDIFEFDCILFRWKWLPHQWIGRDWNERDGPSDLTTVNLIWLHKYLGCFFFLLLLFKLGILISLHSVQFKGNGVLVSNRNRGAEMLVVNEASPLRYPSYSAS